MPSSEVFSKFTKGTLRSSNGRKVTNRKQAIAIKMSEERNERAHGGKYKEGKRNPFKDVT